MTASKQPPGRSPLASALLHDSGYRHTSGEARYVDDLAEPPGTLFAHAVCSPHARARIIKRETGDALAEAGVVAVLWAEDVPGDNQIGAVAHDEPLLATTNVYAEGQAVGLVLGESLEACRRGAAAVVIEYEPLPALLDAREAVARHSFHGEPHVMQRGDVDAELLASIVRIEGELENGGQEHFYLETHAALATAGEGGALHVFSSTQHPSEVQAKVAEVLGVPRGQVVVEVPRLGGGFGGKETQGAIWAAMAALGARHTGRPVKVWLNRDQDMVQTGKRHPFYSRYEAGFDAEGRLRAMRVFLYANGGWASDLSGAILDRGLFHLDNAYYIPALYFEGRVLKTNIASNTAFRGFGGPQGMLVVEEILNRAAERMGLDPAEIRRINFYGGPPRNKTPYEQEVVDSRSGRIFAELTDSADYAGRRAETERFNAEHPHVKRGIGYQPVKFGISFTTSFLNQAGAAVLVYADGSVQLNHGGIEMGQGLHTKMLAVCAHALGVPLGSIRVMNTATDKVPNTSATAASSGSDLNGQAVKEASETVRERMRPVAARLLGVSDADAGGVVFASGEVTHPTSERKVSFGEVAAKAYLERVPLFATGFYATPGIRYDRAQGRGTPFYYYAYGAAVVEVEVSGLTGEHRLLRVDILHDVGSSLVPTMDVGQIEGGFVQGVGWLTCEELVWDDAGRLLTHAPSTYKIPAVGDAPEDFRVRLLDDADQPGVIHGSKAVGEPPLMLGIGVITALRHAIAAFGAQGLEVDLKIPCTHEAVLRAVEDIRQRSQARTIEVSADVDAPQGQSPTP